MVFSWGFFLPLYWLFLVALLNFSMQRTRVNSPRKGQGPLSCVGWGCVNGLTQFAGCKTAKSIPFHNKKTF